MENLRGLRDRAKNEAAGRGCSQEPRCGPRQPPDPAHREAGISECDPMEPRSNVLYFASNRTADGNYDIYRTERAGPGQPWGPIAPVTEVNVFDADDRDPWVSADERYMVFSSDRLGGSVRLFVTTR